MHVKCLTMRVCAGCKARADMGCDKLTHGGNGVSLGVQWAYTLQVRFALRQAEKQMIENKST